jgi:hypothetical protein
MEVLLKKTKITSSILNQCAVAFLNQLMSYEVLGYCVLKAKRWIVLYNSKTNDLKKFPLIKNVKQQEATPPRKPEFEITYYDDSLSGFYRSENNAEMESQAKNILLVRDKAFEKGQFYI